MGTVTIQEFTPKNPLSIIGYEAGICYGTDISNEEKNIKRGLECIQNDHGRTLEFPEIYLTIDGYSAKCMRELYTHIGGAPSRLQASTRYIDYSKGFDTVIPPKVQANEKAKSIWEESLFYTRMAMNNLKDLGIPKEDYTNLLPLAYKSKMVEKMGMRELSNICRVRLCSRAYWEMRNLVNDILIALSKYSDQWNQIIVNTDLFKVKCELAGSCNEKFSCGRFPKKDK